MGVPSVYGPRSLAPVQPHVAGARTNHTAKPTPAMDAGVRSTPDPANAGRARHTADTASAAPMTAGRPPVDTPRATASVIPPGIALARTRVPATATNTAAAASSKPGPRPAPDGRLTVAANAHTTRTAAALCSSRHRAPAAASPVAASAKPMASPPAPGTPAMSTSARTPSARPAATGTIAIATASFWRSDTTSGGVFLRQNKPSAARATTTAAAPPPMSAAGASPLPPTSAQRPDRSWSCRTPPTIAARPGLAAIARPRPPGWRIRPISATTATNPASPPTAEGTPPLSVARLAVSTVIATPVADPIRGEEPGTAKASSPVPTPAAATSASAPTGPTWGCRDDTTRPNHVAVAAIIAALAPRRAAPGSSSMRAGTSAPTAGRVTAETRTTFVAWEDALIAWPRAEGRRRRSPTTRRGSLGPLASTAGPPRRRRPSPPRPTLPPAAAGSRPAPTPQRLRRQPDQTAAPRAPTGRDRATGRR